MKYMKKTLIITFLILTMGTNMDALGFLGFGNSVSWKEEVLLHDGSIIIVERSLTYGGYPTIESRERSTLAEGWVFPVPNTELKITWKVDFQRPPKGMQLRLITVGFLNGTAYIAAEPSGMIAYNYWKRPNPPYVLFKHDGKDWVQIPLSEFPTEFKEANVVVGRPDSWHRSGVLTIAVIKEENKRLQPYQKQIIREPLAKGTGPLRYTEMIYCEDGTWLGIDWFSDQPTYEACLKVCERKKVSPQQCPCDIIFYNDSRGR